MIAVARRTHRTMTPPPEPAPHPAAAADAPCVPYRLTVRRGRLAGQGRTALQPTGPTPLAVAAFVRFGPRPHRLTAVAGRATDRPPGEGHGRDPTHDRG